jgi:hypothetical protein
MAEGSLAAFVFRSIFDDLVQAWDTTQGIPTEKYAPFAERLLPQLNATLDAVSSDNPEKLPAALSRLARAFRDCCSAAAK